MQQKCNTSCKKELNFFWYIVSSFNILEEHQQTLGLLVRLVGLERYLCTRSLNRPATPLKVECNSPYISMPESLFGF